ncbi:hypothetical protein PRIPAC_88369 [Pristionchus pacificus]|uniref:Uncharacterized protein n=1 Tax=Pristionchus pacificus TaxID=54126 RepID=A0A2A6CVF1_PRIPA|nr:hypothetical protein PRIPAC_88369 [Pristionchus pacificus]|eukprot:PDM82139.1 hypothetical protein PRIPAC_36532 [Pristionchus pacificus]
MRLISKRWNNLGMAHLSARKQLPAIKLLTYEILECRPPRNSCKLLIAKPLDHYFGLMNWNSVYTTDEVQRVSTVNTQPETILKFLATHSVEHVVFGHISTYFWTDGKCKSALALSHLFDKVVDVAALNIVDCHKLHFFNLSDLQNFWGIKLGDLMKSAKCQFLYHTSQRNNEFVFDSIEVLRKVE